MSTASRRAALRRLAAGALAGPLVARAAPRHAAANTSTRYPNVVAAQVRARAGGLFDFEVTLSSACDTLACHADAFRVRGPDGRVYGERQLQHHHPGEQRLTRALHRIELPPGLQRVRVQAHDARRGWGGAEVELALPGR